MKKEVKMNENSIEILKKLMKASEEGVLVYRKEKLVSPEDILSFCAVREDMFYDLEFIVKDENGNVKEIWFGDDKKKS